MRYRIRFGVFIGVTIILSLAIGIVSAQEAPKVIVTATTAGDPQSIDPQRASDQGGVNMSNVLFRGLTRLDEEITHEVVPGITTGWDISDDGMIYTFHIIPNIPWVRYNADTSAVEQVMDDNGKPRYVTAQDLVF